MKAGAALLLPKLNAGMSDSEIDHHDSQQQELIHVKFFSNKVRTVVKAGSWIGSFSMRPTA